ncbi:TPR end-of-group domain-containing protein [Desulfovirgula thermocuniculi]|uniref:TPR end-of-group domain-containing protein n=1 Tax=Desulfovirgula thermocuniculi TaxID=348842 RepID=UPI00040E5CE0|nr:tetratricopeptide repeat protein [Desulfovirgula thermocuniculi]
MRRILALVVCLMVILGIGWALYREKGKGPAGQGAPGVPGQQVGETAPAQDPAKEKALQLFWQGYAAYKARRYDEAIKIFDQAIAIDPACHQAYSYKGAALAFKGDYRQAISALDRAIALKPDYEDAYFNKALTYELAGSYEEALANYDRALALNPTNPWSYYGKASIYGRLKNVPLCVENLKRAIELDPRTKEHAKTEADFNPVKNAPEFRKLVYE